MEGKNNLREKLYEIELLKRNRLRPVWAQMDLIAGQPRVLSKLWEKDNISQKNLSDACGIDPATLSRALDRLEQMGYISRRPHPSCRRSVLIGLTQTGREKAEQVLAVLHKMEGQMLQGFEEQDLIQLDRLLSQISQNLAEAFLAF